MTGLDSDLEACVCVFAVQIRTGAPLYTIQQQPTHTRVQLICRWAVRWPAPSTSGGHTEIQYEMGSLRFAGGRPVLADGRW